MAKLGSYMYYHSADTAFHLIYAFPDQAHYMIALKLPLGPGPEAQSPTIRVPQIVASQLDSMRVPPLSYLYHRNQVEK